MSADAASPDWLKRAVDYPYDIAQVPFLFRDGAALPLPDRWRPDGRAPVVAVGSNRSPAQLARKYAGWPAGTEIPVTVAEIAGHDVVYSCHFTRYGALPARLAAAAGVQVQVGITWLTQTQLARMHATEGPENYRFVETAALVVTDGRFGRLGRVALYAGRHPVLRLGPSPLALAAISAGGRRGPAVDQQQALGLARDLLAPGVGLPAFVHQIVTCPVTRAQRSQRLRTRMVPAGKPEADIPWTPRRTP